MHNEDNKDMSQWTLNLFWWDYSCKNNPTSLLLQWNGLLMMANIFLMMIMLKMVEDNDYYGCIEDDCWFLGSLNIDFEGWPECLWLWKVLKACYGRSCIVPYLNWWEHIHYVYWKAGAMNPIPGAMGIATALPGSPAPPWPSLTRCLLETEAMVVQIHPRQSTEDRLAGSSSDSQSPAGGDMPKWNPVITIKVWKNINTDHDVWKHVKTFVTGLITDRTDYLMHLFALLWVCTPRLIPF